MQADDRRGRPGGTPFWWVIATSTGVVTMLAALFAYELFVLGPQGAHLRDVIEDHLSRCIWRS